VVAEALLDQRVRDQADAVVGRPVGERLRVRLVVAVSERVVVVDADRRGALADVVPERRQLADDVVAEVAGEVVAEAGWSRGSSRASRRRRGRPGSCCRSPARR
jgi:hypothetical protein